MLSFLNELALLKEAAEVTSENGPAVKEAKPHLNRISMALFGRKCEPVVDSKRSKKAVFFGVSNTRSKLLDAKGKGVKLTFDNSTDSGEFEINSLTPLKIVQGGDLDKQINSLYKKFKVSSKKKTNYLDVDGEMVLREIHLGTSPSEHAVKLVRNFIKLVHGEKVEYDEEAPKKEEPEEVKESYLNEALPLLKDLIDTNLRDDECFIIKGYISDNKTLEVDESGGGPKVYAQGSLKQCQNWILKNPKYIATIMGADRRLKSHKVPKSYGLNEELQDLSEAIGSPKVIQVKTKLYLCDLNGKDTAWLPKSSGDVLSTLNPGDILVKADESRGRGRYVRITRSGMVEKERDEFTDQEVAKLGTALKVVLKDK